MSVKKIEELKNDKGFKKTDVLVYGALVCLIAVFLTAALVLRDDTPLKGFRIYVGNDAVFDYEVNGEYTVLNSCVKVTETDGGLELYIKCGDGYNVVSIKDEGFVSVTDADCFAGTCIRMPEIRNNGGYIFCSAHALLIQPKNYEPSQQVPIG